MAIKFTFRINTPYAIKLEEKQDYEYHFHFSDMDDFYLMFIYDSDVDTEDKNFCKSIWISGIYKNINYEDFELRKTRVARNRDDDVYSVKLPEREKNEIFLKVKEKLNNILCYLRSKTNIFCIEPIAFTGIGNEYGESIDYNFYSTNADISPNAWESTSINFKVKEIPVHENIFEGFDPSVNYNEPKRIYIKKAEKAIYEGNYDQFIVYASIAVEAFADKYIGGIISKRSEDIVLDAIMNINYDYLNKYYNILLKYLLGKSLKEEKQSNYTYLKRMYTLRNALMHVGEITPKDLKKCGLSKLDYDECSAILSSIEDTFIWMEGLI